MERMVSPGVFTRENDLSFLPQGIAEIGAAFVGPTLKGPAFRPIIVESQEEFRSLFGGTSPDVYVPYAVRNYLREANRATIVRILGIEGYHPVDDARSAILRAGNTILGVIHPTRGGITLSSVSVNHVEDSGVYEPTCDITIDGETFENVSANPSDNNYFARVLGQSPTSSSPGFAYLSFPRALQEALDANSGDMPEVTLELTDVDIGQNELNFDQVTYSPARTPFITTQSFGGTRYPLFRFFTFSDGTSANRDVKVSISSIRPSPIPGQYGTFSVVVRRFNDTDARMEVIEQFDGLNLDPSSPSFIGRRIGTSRPVIDANGDSYLEGDWPNNSRYVYVELDDGIGDIPVDSLPYGHAPLDRVVGDANTPDVRYITSRYVQPLGGGDPVPNNRTHYGFDFNDQTNQAFINPIPNNAGQFNTGFYLDTLVDNGDATDASDINLNGPATAFSLRKFTVPFQGGFDGMNPAGFRNTGDAITAQNTQGFNLSGANTEGTEAYRRAIRTLSNPDSWDVNMIILPGVIHRYHSSVTNMTIDMCERRGDCFYIMDAAPLTANIMDVVNDVNALDTNYAAAYHPWVKIRDTDSSQNIWVPPSTVMVGVFAFNDKVSAEWYAPAGLTRGGITTALQVRSRLAQPDRDFLYEGRVNPIAQFPAQGIVAWGQKTLQQRASALDRINVRRLLIAVKKFIASSSRYLVFEQNVASTRQRFLSIANPYLASVQERNGLYAFRVIMDESNNTPDIIDRNILVGEIYLQPARTAEFIQLTFNVTPTGATFDE